MSFDQTYFDGRYFSYGRDLDVHTTGSGEKPAALFIDGESAFTFYGMEIKGYSGPCIYCKGPIAQTLMFNPTDSYYYLMCPLCQKIFRWLDNNGNTADFKEVTSKKTTVFDEDIDFPDDAWRM